MAAITIGTLNAKLRRLSKNYPELASRIARNAAKASFREVVLKTPVDTGLARGSWRVTQGRASRAKARNRDKTGSPTLAAGFAVINGARVDQAQLVITNVAVHTDLINRGIVTITKARPFAGPGFVEEALNAASASISTDSIFRTYRF